MYRRRRLSAASVLPTTRRHADARTNDIRRTFQPGDDHVHAALTTCSPQFGRAVGASYISSSSSSSNSSSSTSRSSSPVRRSTRTMSRRHANHTAQLPIVSSRSRAVTALRTGSSEHPATEDVWDRSVHATSSSLARCGVPVNAKPTSRSRRRAVLRSPIFRLILSPDNSPPPAGVPMAEGVRPLSHSETFTQPSLSNQDDSIQIVYTEGVEQVQPIRLRNARTGTRSSRANPLSRRSTRPTRSAAHRNDQSTLLSGPNHSHTAVDSAELQAALTVARTVDPETEDDCVICLDPKSNRSIVLPCMHTFCFDCIYRWLCINPSCPLCKRLAHRIVHSILSDSDFAELLVSELQERENTARPITGLSANFDPAEDEVTSAQRSHHHFHYHLEAQPVRFVDYLDGMTHGNSARTSLFIPPILIPSDSSFSRSSALMGGSHRVSYRWGSDVGSAAESRRALLTGLVNNALRPRDSSLMDGLLLRQLVYVFGFDSVPVPQEPELERIITPDFLAANETHQHRLEAFIRRELRVLAPWLAYLSTGNSSPVLREQTALSTHLDQEDTASPAVTSPLICGSPGLLADTPELDELTARVVQHCTTMSITNVSALVALLSSFPALTVPLVPASYISHFASEVLQFARYAGTLEQYDSAVCLYRRRLNVVPLPAANSQSRPPRTVQPDPRLAVYVASACWPRLRPGFSQPQGLVTHPLINWLLQRLFVHSVSGPVHPALLSGTGERPCVLPDRPAYPSNVAPSCHPNCLRLESLSRALLEALPSSSRLHTRSFSRQVASTAPDSYVPADGRDDAAQPTARRMTDTELYPNRLLYQRVLSELIDQARFSEALSSHFSQHCSNGRGVSQQTSASALDLIRPSEPPATSVIQSQMQHNETSLDATTSPVETLPSEQLEPAIGAHPSALRRLNGLLLLFTARIPGLGNGDSDEDWLSELLHMPLLPTANMAPSSALSRVIDLTASRERVSPTERHMSGASVDSESLSGTDWNFLRQLPWNSLGIWSTRDRANVIPIDPTPVVPSPIMQNTVDFESSFSSSLMSNPSASSPSHIFQHPHDDTHNRTHGHLDVGWRDSIPCVVISSDSSSDDERVVSRTVHALTADDSDGGDHFPPSSLNHDAVRSVSNLNRKASLASENVDADTHDPCSIVTIQTNTSSLSLTSKPSTSLGIVHDTSTDVQEPMDVDEKNDISSPVVVASSRTGSKRPAQSAPTSVCNGVNQIADIRPPKLIKIGEFFADILQRLQRVSEARERNSPFHTSRSVSDLIRSPHRHTHHLSRNRSPIHLESSDSDCELLQEYIHVDSHSSCCSSSSQSDFNSTRSASSASSSRRRATKSRSTGRSGRIGRHSRCSLHRCCKSSHHRCCHKRRTCCCASRHHRYHARRSCRCHSVSRRKHYSSNIRHRHPKIISNSPSSPILISDDNEGLTDDACAPPSCDASQAAHSLSFTQPAGHIPNPQLTCNTSVPQPEVRVRLSPIQSPSALTPLPSTSTSLVRKDVQDISTSTTDLPRDPPSRENKLAIFEPCDVSDFYRFLERFEPPTSHAEPRLRSPDRAVSVRDCLGDVQLETKESPKVMESTDSLIVSSDASVLLTDRTLPSTSDDSNHMDSSSTVSSPSESPVAILSTGPDSTSLVTSRASHPSSTLVYIDEPRVS
ncbi:hypothetical protein P879_01171 [Paragonimus westermani]|uniref:RING-type E3 ubiquitin transferase n=1 Tax=Paragonimus westermani TaxID=34504 RepID=A0A8T0DM59_9TREM|nr:hypothetical protein P879_01171 [Paragonimus westermani]